MSIFQVLSYSAFWVGERFFSEYTAKHKAPIDNHIVQEAWKNYAAVNVALRLLFSFMGLFAGTVWLFALTLGYYPGYDRYWDSKDSYVEWGTFALLLFSRFIGYFVFSQVKLFLQGDSKPDAFVNQWVGRLKSVQSFKAEAVAPVAELVLVVYALLFRTRHFFLFETIDIFVSLVEILLATFAKNVKVDVVLLRKGLSIYLLLQVWRYAGWSFVPIILVQAVSDALGLVEKFSK